MIRRYGWLGAIAAALVILGIMFVPKEMVFGHKSKEARRPIAVKVMTVQETLEAVGISPNKR